MLKALAFRGEPGSGTYPECGGAGYTNWADGLSLVFDAGRFAGWTLDRRAAGALSTMSGVGPGSTRIALENAYRIKVSRTTLGTEFTTGGISGLLNGTGYDATITTMWAGATCLAR